MPEDDQNKGGEDQKGAGEQGGTDEKVELSASTYNALLDKLEELEGTVAAAAKGGRREEIDDLADEGRGRRRVDPDEKPVDLENLTNRDLANMILGHVEQNMMQPILVTLERMRIQGEIRDLGVSDFDDYKDDIYKIASKNPTLSIKQAYNLAKQENPSKGKNKEENPNTRRSVITDLPPRRNISGERPGTSASATRRGEPDSMKDAISLALEDMKKAGKTI